MVVLVCGGRDFSNRKLLVRVLNSLGNITMIINGGANGADKLSSWWAKKRGVPFKEFPADWKKHGRAAGPIRNQEMLDSNFTGHNISMVIAFPGGKGTADMIRRAKRAGKTVMVVDSEFDTSTDMTLAIETGIESEYEQRLIASAVAAGWNVRVVANIPFTEMFVNKKNDLFDDPVEQELLDNSRVWFHGSIQAAKAAQKATKWQVHAPWHNLRCSQYYLRLDGKLTQEDHRIIKLSELPILKDELFESLGEFRDLRPLGEDRIEDLSIFCRPDGNDKVFTGGCVSQDKFDEGYDLMTFYEPPPETRIVVSRPQVILSEARFLVVDGELITGSYYKTGGQSVRLEATDHLMELGEEFLGFCKMRGYDPSPSWVLDLAETPEGWSIIEVGASSCCGLYKCDTDKFIEALSRFFEVK
jgi:hypothetical protein